MSLINHWKLNLGKLPLSLPEYSLYQLLSESKTSHHSHIRNLWADTNIHYLVVFQGKREDDRAILSVGPTLDYRSLKEVIELEIDGMRAQAYIRSRHCPQKSHSGHTSNLFKKGQSGNSFAGNKAEAFSNNASGLAFPAVETSGPSNGDWGRLKRKEEELRNLTEELQARESYITECETRLSMLAEEYHSREVELTHREETLNEMEFKLAQRESELERQAAQI